VPGPLTGADLDSSRTLVAPFFRFDENNQSRTYGRIELSHPLGERLELTARLAGEARSVEAFETLALSPDFADTKFRDLATRRGSGLVALRLSEFSDRLPGQLVVGLEGALGSMTSSYAGVLTGDRSVYESSDSVEAGDVLAASDVDRATLSAFVHVEINPADRLRLTAGARFDGIGDDFQPAPPSEGDDASDSHRALSPKLGVNYRFLSTNNHVGNVYGSIGHTFKAPTLDQLYDQRTIPVPFPPFEISLSSSGLKPQRGWSYEIGAYYRANVGPSARVEGTLAVYQIDMRDELDFDLETLSYLNIGKSRHRGVEAGVRAYLGSRASAFVNYTHQAVTLEYGANSGKYVKAIPRNVVRGGIEGSVGGGFGGSVAVSHTGSVYLDDANTIPLSDFTSADAQVWFERAQVRFAVQVINLLDSEHSSTGYPDPAGSQVLYLYPVAGRHFRAGLTIQLGGA
jgi:outer membrane cobalamin receptor